MAKSMTKADIVSKLADKTGLSKKDAQAALDELAQLAYKQAKNDFTIPGIGKLHVTKRKARKGVNPATGESMRIPAGRVVKFRVSKTAKDAILGKKKK